MRTGPHRILVVGGGAAGVITAAHLLEEATRDATPVDVTVVERGAALGPGLAYGTTEPLHLLNNYAGRMSALEHDAEHLVQWCRRQGIAATHDTFLPRETYGRYLSDLLDDLTVPAGSTLSRVQDEVVEVSDAGTAYFARTAGGRTLTVDVVVLALGNPPPRRPRGITVDDEHFVANPWAPGLIDRVPEEGRVLLVGTGLTTVDVAAQIAAGRPRARVTAVSRHGLLPLTHVVDAPGPAREFDHDVRTLRGVVAEARRCVRAGCDWRSLVESVKASANEIWSTLTEDEREQFVRHVARYWEISRHRMAPAMAEVVEDLLHTGRLTITTSSQVDPAAYDVVVNCTGPAPVSSTGWNPLVDSLAVAGMLWPGPFGLGVDTDATGALVDADGQPARGLYAVGAARRGVEWEVAAVPDIRRQAARIAAALRPSYDEPSASLVG